MKNMLSLAFAVCFNVLVIYGQPRSEPYDYPVKPGTNEWRKLETGAEKIKVLTIPPPILKSLDDLSLAQTCLNFPLFYEIVLANNIQQGFTALTSHFNGFQELLTREKSGSALIQLYQRMDVKKLDKSWPSSKQGKYTFSFTYIELLLAQNEIIQNLTPGERNVLKKLALITFDNKKRHLDVFSDFGLNTSALLLGKIIIADGKQQLLSRHIPQKDLEIYLNTGTFRNKDLITTIYNASKSY